MEKYDFALSIGETCKPALYLKATNLRTVACPFDWLVCDIQHQVELYKNHFSSFFDEYYEDYSINSDKNMRNVRDSKNIILSMHHIRLDIPLEEGVKDFKSLMMRRYERLNDILNNSKSILLVSDQQCDISILKQYVLEFAKIYPNKIITLVNVLDDDVDFNVCKYQITDKIRIEQYSFNDVYDKDIHDNTIMGLGNEKYWKMVLSNFELNNSDEIGV